MEKTNYTKLIDAQTWAFIRKTESYYPLNTLTLDIQGQRDVYNKMCRAFFKGYPKNIRSKDMLADGVPVRCYEKLNSPAEVIILYYHGGGFVVGGLESHDDICAEICDQTGFQVISVDYRLAPEYLHPAAFEDCLRVFHWAQKKNDMPMIVVGDSAGGNLATAVAHRVRYDRINIAGAVLIYPALGHANDQGSFRTHANAPLLSREDVDFYADIRNTGADASNDVSYAPLNDDDFSNLPPSVIISAECDPLCDDGEIYSAAIKEAGGQSIWIKEMGLVHGYLRARHSVDRARNSFMRIIAAIDYFGKNAGRSDDNLGGLRQVLFSIGDEVSGY